MNRRNFLRNLVLGAAAVPCAMMASRAPAEDEGQIIPRPGAKSFPLPANCGKVICMAHFDGHIWVACENGLYHISMSVFRD